MGAHVRGGVATFYAAAVALWALSFWLLRGDPVALVALLPMAGHLGWQVSALQADDGADALAKFRSNRFAGLLLAAACYVVGNTGG
jgi:4-hydroxybenzoate polyprenyltransferase